MGSDKLRGSEALVVFRQGVLLLSEIREQFVFFRSSDVGLSQFGRVTLHLDGLSWFRHDVGLREIGIEKRQHSRRSELAFIREFAIVDAYGVNARQGSVVTVDIKFGLLDACDFTFEDKLVFGLRTGGEQ